MTRVEERARAAIGSRFRLGGRNPAHGLDCVGLVAWALEVDDAPSGYALRGGVPERVIASLDARLRRVEEAEPGDVLLFGAGPAQLHLGIASARGLIHADAALRRVAERPGVMPWPVLGVWRETPSVTPDLFRGPTLCVDRAREARADGWTPARRPG